MVSCSPRQQENSSNLILRQVEENECIGRQKEIIAGYKLKKNSINQLLDILLNENEQEMPNCTK